MPPHGGVLFQAAAAVCGGTITHARHATPDTASSTIPAAETLSRIATDAPPTLIAAMAVQVSPTA